MGWTRNAQNVIFTACASRYSVGSTTESAWGYGDTVPWTIKTNNGSVYQIPMKGAWSSSWFSWAPSRSSLLDINVNTNSILSINPPVIKDTAPADTPGSSQGASLLRFGDGDAAESFEDYKLSGNILPCKGISSSASIYYSGDGMFSVDIYCTAISNTTCTIKEYGLYGSTYFGTQSALYCSEYLVYRHKLSEYISVTKDCSFKIHIHIDLPRLSLSSDGWVRNAHNMLYANALLYTIPQTSSVNYNDFSDETPWLVKNHGGHNMFATKNASNNGNNGCDFIPAIIGNGVLSLSTFNVAETIPQSSIVGSSGNPLPSNCLVFGGGSSPWSINDYAITDFVPCKKFSDTCKIVSKEDGTFSIQGTIGVITLSSGTINEWALYGQMSLYLNYDVYYGTYMLYRKVLDEPIIADAGQPFFIDISLDTPKIIMT